MKSFGKELILDLSNCNSEKFNRKSIEGYFVKLCELIKMDREKLCWWDYKDCPEEYDKAPTHLKGTTAVQFIKTSNITIHTLDELGEVFLNIFSCKDFDASVAAEFSANWFEGEVANKEVVERGKTPRVEILQQKGNYFLWIDNYLWMWDIPVERKAQKDIADKAFGDVLVVGYGLGLVQRYLVENPKVKSVMTLENLKEVIQECKKVYGVIHGEVEIIDFFKYGLPRKFDCVVGDCWEDILEECLGGYKKFKDKAVTLLKPQGQILAWGREFFEYLIAKQEAR